MSNNFYDNVVAEIQRREKEQQKERNERLMLSKKEQSILGWFDEHLKECLENLSNYNGHCLRSYPGDANSSFCEVLKELGFNCTTENDLYFLSVPALEKGQEPTPAQVRLIEFEQKLSKALNERKRELLIECSNIKQRIEEGEFEYCKVPALLIQVRSEQAICSEFEKEVINNFFFKLDLTFAYVNEHNDWVFTL